MIPGGLLIDRVGPRAALMIVGFGSSLFVCLTGGVGLSLEGAGPVFLGLVIVRSLMGLVSAPLHPACARAVGNWVPLHSRSLSNGMINGSALVGIAAAPRGFGALINRFGWPAAFLIMGGLTVVVASFWTIFASDTPSGRSLARKEKERQPSAPSPGAWHELLSSRSLVLVTLAYGAIGYFQYMFFYWMSYYFETVLDLSNERSHNYAAIPPLAMAVGMPLGGWFADRLEHVRGTSRSRKIVPMAGMSMGAILLVIGVLVREPVWIVAWFALALFSVGLAEGPTWSTAVELGGHRGGSAAGILNFGGNAGGILAPIITPWVGQFLGWGYAVALGGLICMAGVGLWIWIDPREKPKRMSVLGEWV
jgi:MFS family permease